MHKQRIILILMGLAGIISVFLPWVSAPLFGSVSGAKFDTGILIIVMYSANIVAALFGDRGASLKGLLFYLCLVLPFAAGAIALSNILKINSDMSAHHSHMNIYEIGFGLYLIIAIGVVTPLLAFVFRMKRQAVGSQAVESQDRIIE